MQSKSIKPDTGRLKKRPVLFFLAVIILLAFLSQANADVASDLNRKGLAELKEGRHREAIVYFESAHKAGPYNKNIQKNLSVAYHGLAVLQSVKRNWQDAIHNEEQALRFDPDSKVIKEQLSIFYNNYGLEYADKGSYKKAVMNLESALEHYPDSETVKTNLYNVYLRYSEHSLKHKNYRKALKLSKDAVKLLPDRAAAYVYTGNIYYNQDKFKESLKYWEKALEIEPDNKDIHEKIAKIRREKKIEQAFGTEKKRHFKIRYDKELDDEYIELISDILDDARVRVRDQFNLSTSETVAVIVYGDEQFKNVTTQPHWTLGLYDGKIRIKYQDIRGSEFGLRRTLYHEYAHAILYLNYGNNIPKWLHEGFAQYNEPDRLLSTGSKRFLREYLKEHGAFSLEKLDGMLSEKADEAVVRAGYLESKLFFQYLINKYTKYRMRQLLKKLQVGAQWQVALKEVYHNSIKRFDRDFNKYLENMLGA